MARIAHFVSRSRFAVATAALTILLSGCGEAPPTPIADAPQTEEFVPSTSVSSTRAPATGVPETSVPETSVPDPTTTVAAGTTTTDSPGTTSTTVPTSTSPPATAPTTTPTSPAAPDTGDAVAALDALDELLAGLTTEIDELADDLADDAAAQTNAG